MEGQSPGKRGGDADLLTATCRKKTCKRDQNPEDGKEETLKDYKRLQKELKEILHQATEKLLQFLTKPSLPETRNGVEYLKNHLTGLKLDSLMDPIYIGLFGNTGTGKSTLLNSIIDKQYFLPVSGTTSCTSCVVQVSSNHSKHYEAKIHLLTPEEWKDELKRLVVLAEHDDDEDDPVRSEAVSKITAIYGEGAEMKSYEELCRTSRRIGNARGIINLRKENRFLAEEGYFFVSQKEDFSEALRPYVSTQSSHSGTSEEDEIGKLWPLIKHVEVSVPRMEVVPEGVIFMDIPGMGDSNSKRDAIWKENINKCAVIWVVSGIGRIDGEKNHETLLNEGMKAFQRGMCRDISLVVTKSDQMNLQEYLWEKKKKDMNIHDAILERNETVKRKKMQMMKKNLKKQLPSDSRVLHKDDLVYTVSATEYWNGEKLSKEETEIPKLRDYIRKFYQEQKRDILKDYVTEAWVIFSLIQSLRSNQEIQCGNTSRMEEFVPKTVGLGADIEKCFTAIERPLIEGVDQAKKTCDKIINKILNRVPDGRGFHKTLKAVCLNKGVHVSRVFGRIDINNSLAQPIYDNIDMSFGNIFRIQMGTRSTLKTCLDMFKDAMKQQLQEAMGPSVSDRGVKFSFLQQETDYIFRETEKIILQRKAEIYNSLSVSIQDNLLSCYEETARQRGAQAYTRMQTILRKGIMEQLESGMFEKARDSMREHFQALKVEIIQKVKKDFSDMLGLVFGPWDQFTSKLPDLQDEVSFIHAVRSKLDSASNV